LNGDKKNNGLSKKSCSVNGTLEKPKWGEKKGVKSFKKKRQKKKKEVRQNGEVIVKMSKGGVLLKNWCQTPSGGKG